MSRPRRPALARRRRRPVPALERPTPERLGQDPHERVVVSEGGEVRRLYRALDAIDVMRRNGTISAAQHAAGRRFREDFDRAQFDPLHAVNPARLTADSGVVERSVRASAARDRIWRAMIRMGGLEQLLARACWWVIGAGLSFREFARRCAWSGGGILDYRVVIGLVIAALAVLAGSAA